MGSRPFVLLSVASSLDGYIDDTSGIRLLLSNAEDFERVDRVRAGVDAILVGANTIRTDDPRLMVRSEVQQRRRRSEGRPSTPVKVTLTRTGEISPAARFFTTGDSDKLVYTTTSAAMRVRQRIGEVAEVVDVGDPLGVDEMLADLADRKVGRLLVEGGSEIHTLMLTAGVVDELHVVYAPFFVGQADAPRVVNPAEFPQGPGQRMTLAGVDQIGDVVLLRYHPRTED